MLQPYGMFLYCIIVSVMEILYCQILGRKNKLCQCDDNGASWMEFCQVTCGTDLGCSACSKKEDRAESRVTNMFRDLLEELLLKAGRSRRSPRLTQRDVDTCHDTSDNAYVNGECQVQLI